MNRKTRDILIFALLAILFIIVTVKTSSDSGLNYPAYTVFSAEADGSSLIYDTLKHLGYNVDISYKFIDENTSIDDVQFVINPSYYNTSRRDMEDLAKWVEKGGILVFTSDGIFSLGDYFAGLISGEEFTYFGRGFVYYYGAGRVYTLDSKYLTNEDLMTEKSSTGDSIMVFLDNFSHNKIYFNESYHGYTYEENFWEMMPFSFRITVYQIAIVIIACVLYLGKRFGKAVPYYEEIEREENEYIPALANLYMSVGMGSGAIDALENKFIAKAAEYFRINEPDLKSIYELWKAFNLPEIDKLEHLILNSEVKINTKTPKGKREFSRQYHYYKALTRIVSKKD